MSETQLAKEFGDLPHSPSTSQDEGNILSDGKHTVAPTRSGPPFPDGGVRAWMTILSCFLVSFTSYGQLNAFGVFQTYYADNQLAGQTASNISWIGSLQLSIIYFSGLFLGPAMDRYGSKVLLIAGWLLSAFCLMMLSLSTSYYQILLSQGLGFGVGAAFQFYPLLIIPAHWFKKKRALAMGIVVSGSSLSGVVFPIMLSRLFDFVGFPWAVRTLAFMCFTLQAFSIPFIKERFPPQVGAPRFDPSASQDMPFVLHVIGALFISFGLYTPLWYIELYALQQGVNGNLSFYFISIMNASAIFGRVILGELGDALGRFNVMILALILATIAPLAIWTTSHDSGTLIAFAIVFGFTAAAYMSLAPACSAQLTSDPSYIGARVGILMTAMAPGILTGPSIGGALISATNESYIGLQCFVGGTIALGTVFAIAARFAAKPCVRAKF